MEINCNINTDVLVQLFSSETQSNQSKPAPPVFCLALCDLDCSPHWWWIHTEVVLYSFCGLGLDQTQLASSLTGLASRWLSIPTLDKVNGIMLFCSTEVFKLLLVWLFHWGRFDTTNSTRGWVQMWSLPPCWGVTSTEGSILLLITWKHRYTISYTRMSKSNIEVHAQSSRLKKIQ